MCVCVCVGCDFSWIPFDLIYYMTKFGQFQAANNLIPRDERIPFFSLRYAMPMIPLCSIIQLHLSGMQNENRFVACALLSFSITCKLCSYARARQNNGTMYPCERAHQFDRSIARSRLLAVLCVFLLNGMNL